MASSWTARAARLRATGCGSICCLPRARCRPRVTVLQARERPRTPTTSRLRPAPCCGWSRFPILPPLLQPQRHAQLPRRPLCLWFCWNPRGQASSPLTPAEMSEMLARAGALHNIDADLLASVVQAESNGNARAVSRAGAEGLMQLMPATASQLGVRNTFAPEENIGGGTAYLDALLTRYHDDIAAGGRRLQRGAGRGRPLPRHSTLRRDARLRGPRDPRVQSPQARRTGGPHQPDGGRKVARMPHRRAAR